MRSEVRLQLSGVDLNGLQRLANSMVDCLDPPLTIGLVGTLGAGKTSLVQALARAANIDSADVTSPTFTLLQTHHGRICINHLDAYRLSDEDEFLELGVEELFAQQDAWTLIEWADRVEGVMPLETVWIMISVEDDPTTRTITFAFQESLQQKLGRLIKDYSSDDDKG